MGGREKKSSTRAIPSDDTVENSVKPCFQAHGSVASTILSARGYFTLHAVPSTRNILVFVYFFAPSNCVIEIWLVLQKSHSIFISRLRRPNILFIFRLET